MTKATFDSALEWLLSAVEDCPEWADLDDCIDFTLDNLECEIEFSDADLITLNSPVGRTALYAAATLITTSTWNRLLSDLRVG